MLALSAGPERAPPPAVEFSARRAECLVRVMHGPPAPVDELLPEPVRRPWLVLAHTVAAGDEMLGVGVDGVLAPLADSRRLQPVSLLEPVEPLAERLCACYVHGSLIVCAVFMV